MSKPTFYSLAASSNKALESIFLHGTTPDPNSLAGWEFRGYNRPFFASLLGIRKFKKGFYFLDKLQNVQIQAGESGGGIGGYNIPVTQNSLEKPYLMKPSEQNPKRFGWYLVYKVREKEIDNKYPHALLLNYGLGGNSFFEPAKLLRDYLVQADSSNPDLYLGKAYIALRNIRVFTNFFILERMNQSNFKKNALHGGIS